MLRNVSRKSHQTQEEKEKVEIEVGWKNKEK